MRYLVVSLLLVLVSAASPAHGQQQKAASLAIDFDWTKVRDQERLADALREKSLLPSPLIFVDGRLRAVVPAEVEIPSDTISTRLEIGLIQFTERPLYTIDLGRDRPGRILVQTTYPELGISHNYRMPTGEVRDVVALKGLVKTSTSATLQDGRYSLALPAEPYAILAEFAGHSSGGLRATPIVPVIQLVNDKPYPPIEWLLPRYDYDFSKLIATEASVYRANIVTSWAAAWLIGDPLRAQPRDALRLGSIPSQAEIYIAGYVQPSTTDTIVQTPRDLWGTIVVRKKAFADCPFDMAELTPGNPPSFVCKLRKR
jgi:hypothetical protein